MVPRVASHVAMSEPGSSTDCRMSRTQVVEMRRRVDVVSSGRFGDAPSDERSPGDDDED